jgi:hypothetical protein
MGLVAGTHTNGAQPDPAGLLRRLDANDDGQLNEADQSWLKAQQTRYAGPPVNSLPDLRAYTGKAAAGRIVGEDRRTAYLLNYRQLCLNYGDAVEFQLRQEQVILCPQTLAFLYDGFTPLRVRYVRGSRPRLERVAVAATAGCRSGQNKALALMRLCRDLHRQAPNADFSEYIYGGTEEQMLDKPEILCETLGRLFVALCEVVGIPGRIVMHNLGGHIGAEVYVDGHWAYIDPRCGVYFLQANGRIASVLELWQNPAIIRTQPASVKADISAQWRWPLRAWKCENMYFSPDEVHGFENYSLADSGRYRYTQLPHRQAVANGLMEINRTYVATARRALGLAAEGWAHAWDQAPLKKIDIAYRHDGFSIFFKQPPMDRKELMRRYIDPFRDSNVSTLVWGVGPGSVFCYETKVGEIFGEGLSAQQLALLREGDRWVNQNVLGLIREGGGPLQMAVAGARGIGRKLIARLEMNHEYGPPNDDNWQWVAFVGSLNKKHPEYRIGESVFLDFKHQEVRDFKLAILRETVQLGADGVSLDFAVYPPFFANPDAEIMTGFVREVRAMLDAEGQKRGQRLDLMVRVPAADGKALGLDWERWMDEGLIDCIFPTHRRAPDYFDLRVEHFIDKGVETGIPVYPTVWQALGFVDTDPRPSGKARYDKPKTPGMFRAQALLFMRAGAAGIQLGMSADQWLNAPWMNDLADPDKLLVADKHYMVDPIALRPGAFELQAEGDARRGQRTLSLRLGDDVPAARRAGYDVAASLVVYCRPLADGERLEVYVNDHGPVTISGDEESERQRRGAAVADPTRQAAESFIFDKDWWKRGEHTLPVPADWWQLGSNAIRLAYSTPAQSSEPPLSVTWVDLLLDYRGP